MKQIPKVGVFLISNAVMAKYILQQNLEIGEKSLWCSKHNCILSPFIVQQSEVPKILNARFPEPRLILVSGYTILL